MIVCIMAHSVCRALACIICMNEELPLQPNPSTLTQRTLMPILRVAFTPLPLHSNARRGNTAVLAAAISAVALALTACGKPEEAPAAGAQQAPQVEVGVVTATPGDVGLLTELPG